MKNLLCLALLFTAACAFADAPPVIVITTLDHVSVNGGPPFPLGDALTNYRQERAAILAKVSEYERALINRANAAEVAAQAAQDALTVNLANQLEVVTSARAALDSQATAPQKVAAFEQVVAIAEQKRDEREARRKEAEAAALRAEADLKQAEAEALRANP